MDVDRGFEGEEGLICLGCVELCWVLKTHSSRLKYLAHWFFRIADWKSRVRFPPGARCIALHVTCKLRLAWAKCTRRILKNKAN